MGTCPFLVNIVDEVGVAPLILDTFPRNRTHHLIGEGKDFLCAFPFIFVGEIVYNPIASVWVFNKVKERFSYMLF